jgi:signal transducing adaptor molecule
VPLVQTCARRDADPCFSLPFQYANASLAAPSAGLGASGSSTSLTGEPSGSSSSAGPAAGQPSEHGQLPQDDEKRRLFEKARAEAEAYQIAHRAYIAQQQQQQAPQPLQM